MKIHDYKGFPNPARIRIALAEKGLTHAVEFVTVDVPAGEHKRPEFLARNPAGTVPVLELEDGAHIAECTAITEYLDHLDCRPILTGKTARERASEYCHELVCVPHRQREKFTVGFYAELLSNLLSPVPYAVQKYASLEMRKEIQKRAADCDVVICDFLAPAVNVPTN